jgi:hypothetical protein
MYKAIPLAEFFQTDASINDVRGRASHGAGGQAMATLSSTIERLTGKGFTLHFGVVGNRLRAFESGRRSGHTR